MKLENKYEDIVEGSKAKVCQKEPFGRFVGFLRWPTEFDI